MRTVSWLMKLSGPYGRKDSMYSVLVQIWVQEWQFNFLPQDDLFFHTEEMMKGRLVLVIAKSKELFL